MLVLGLLFLAAATVAAVELIIANDTAQVTFHKWNATWLFDAFWLAVIGAGIITVAWLGFAMMRVGSARALRLRRERRELAKENAMLAQRARGVRTAPPAPAGNPGDATTAMPAAATGPATATRRRRHFMRGAAST
jgi:hypothetical protein